MTFLDKYPSCIGCPVSKWCGTAVSSIRLCNSLEDSIKETEEDVVLEECIKEHQEQDYLNEQLDYTLWEKIFEEEIQGKYDRL